MRDRYSNVETIIESVVSDEEMGLKKRRTFTDLLVDAVNQAAKLPKGKGVRISGIVPIGTLSGIWSYAKKSGKINGECVYFLHKSRIYIRPNK